jgi:hypothetical protein
MRRSATSWLRLLVEASYFSAFVGLLIVVGISLSNIVENVSVSMALSSVCAIAVAVLWVMIYATVRLVMDAKAELVTGLTRISNLLLIALGFEAVDQLGVLSVATQQFIVMYRNALQLVLSGVPLDQAIAGLDFSVFTLNQPSAVLPWLFPMTSGLTSVMAVLLLRIYCQKSLKRLDAMPSS